MTATKIGRHELKAPALVLTIDLLSGSEYESRTVSVEGYRTIWCLTRMDGVPVDISFWNVEALEKIETSMLLSPSFDVSTSQHNWPSVADGSCDLTVAICTRERPQDLHRALMSLMVQTDQNFSVLVVDNAPITEQTRLTVESFGMNGMQYVVETQPGLSRARNRALSEIRTNHVAWMDDDELADPDWISNIKRGFAHECSPVAVCGVMLPAELQFEAQVRFEQYGGFNKGRGLQAEVLSADSLGVISPLYPLPAVGSGGNMAFQMKALEAVGGFDNCLGAGTKTHGGEETKVFSELLRNGWTVLHWPTAVTWHFHRRDMEALHKQFYGYGAGLTAFYASMIRSKPSVSLELLKLAPHAVRDLGVGSGGIRTDQLPGDFPSSLMSKNRRGMLAGAFNYVREVVANR